MRIAILGSTGMLGNYIYQYFTTKSQHKIFTSTRCASNSSIVFHLDAMDYRTIRNIPDVDYVINCIGCIKQKKYTDQEFYKINSIFPHILSVECSSKNIRLIHVTTDCVYSGSKGSYIESDIPDCDDVYGISKLLSEDLIHGMILRSSIIGEEVNSAYSLLSWAKSQRSSTVRGYTNHFWNGVTNLQFAKICEKIINDDLYSEGIKHIFSSNVSKYEMLCSFNKKYNLNLNIESYEHVTKIDRTLSTMFDLQRKLYIPNYEEMLDEL